MKLNAQTKVGLFSLITLIIIGYFTMRVSDRGTVSGRGYSVSVVIDSAEGLTRKTPVEVAGIQVGYIQELELENGRHARVVLRIDRRVRLGEDAQATVRTKGMLGETYIDLRPGDLKTGEIADGGEIKIINPYTNLGQLVDDAGGFARTLREIAEGNQKNIDQILESLAQFSKDLRDLMANRKESLSDTMQRLSNITAKVDDGRGTLGRIINDDELADNLNEAARGVSETIGGINRFQFEMGYHLEYLGRTKDFKNYVGFNLMPRPDKYFILEFVVDPAPPPTETVTTTSTTTGGVVTNSTEEKSIVTLDDFRLTAQMAKTFYDFTLRGGIIESAGGLGLDWERGPLRLEFSAFDFRNRGLQRPHLKAMARLKLNKNFFIVSGADDFLSQFQRVDWFVGGGVNLLDQDIKALFTAAAAGASSAR